MTATISLNQFANGDLQIIIKRQGAWKSIPVCKSNVRRVVIAYIVHLTNNGYRVDDQTGL